jgi:HPt (histidine-containing phosphotransfer) domain-containing protein
MPASNNPERYAAQVNRALKPIFRQFLETQSKHLGGIRLALERGALKDASRLAHSVKGATGTYELPEAAAQAAALEAAVQAGDPAQVEALLDRLAAYLDALDVAFVDPTDAPKDLPGR